MLARSLIRYSEEGEAYVRKLRQLIRTNRLGGYETARLMPRGDVYEIHMVKDIENVRVTATAAGS